MAFLRGPLVQSCGAITQKRQETPNAFAAFAHDNHGERNSGGNPCGRDQLPPVSPWRLAPLGSPPYNCGTKGGAKPNAAGAVERSLRHSWLEPV